MLEQLVSCPYCNSGKISDFLKVQDFTVSRETFQIQECLSCGLIFTNPRPDQSNIGRYYQSEDYISHTNSKKGLVNKIYQAARQIALKRKLRLIRSLAETGSLLDIGCGTGEFLAFCKSHGYSCTGIEPDEQARKLAMGNYGLSVHPPAYLDTIAQGAFDIVSMWHVLEHVPDPKSTIQKLHTILKTNGHAVIAVPNPTSFDSQKYREFWAAFDVPRHLFHYRPAFIKSAFAQSGFEFIRSRPMSMDAYYVSLLSEKYKAGRVGAAVLLKAVLGGLRSNLNASSSEEYSSVIYVFKKTTSAR